MPREGSEEAPARYRRRAHGDRARPVRASAACCAARRTSLEPSYATRVGGRHGLGRGARRRVARPFFSGTAGTPETRVDISTPEAPDPTAFAISPDGRRLVFVAFRNGQTQLFLRSLDGDSTQPLSGTEAAILPFWSPDGRSVGFFARQDLKRIDIDGGLVQTVARAQPGPGGAWGPDGMILFAPCRGAVVHRCQPRAESLSPSPALGAGQSAHRSPVFLPGRQAVPLLRDRNRGCPRDLSRLARFPGHDTADRRRHDRRAMRHRGGCCSGAREPSSPAGSIRRAECFPEIL